LIREQHLAYRYAAMSKIAELALLAKASGLGGRAATDDEAFRRYFGELGLELGELEDVDSWPDA